jgi:hypothetical protein
MAFIFVLNQRLIYFPPPLLFASFFSVSSWLVEVYVWLFYHNEIIKRIFKELLRYIWKSFKFEGNFFLHIKFLIPFFLMLLLGCLALNFDVI